MTDKNDMLQVVNDVAAGLAYMHPNIIHSDLKPQNILLAADGRAKIADFGISRVKVGRPPARILPSMMDKNNIMKAKWWILETELITYSI